MQSYIINPRNLGRSKLCMVGSATGWVYPASSNSLLKDCVINCKIEHFVNFSTLFLQHLIKLKRKKKRRSIVRRIANNNHSAFTHNPNISNKKNSLSSSDGKQGNTFCAWTTVLGKPSRMKPFWHDGFFIASSMMPTTKSSETSSPWMFCSIMLDYQFYRSTLGETIKAQVRLDTKKSLPFP